MLIHNTELKLGPWSTLPDVARHAADALGRIAAADELEAAVPPLPLVFRAFDLVPPKLVKVCILGQDPYPVAGDAMGLAFGSNAATRPASLRNIFKEFASDIGGTPTVGNDLIGWAEQGVLLANTALTLGPKGTSHHAEWAEFTRAWITQLAQNHSVIWVLWGKKAQAWRGTIDANGNKAQVVLEAAHPSPLSARHGFFGSKPFTKINALLTIQGKPAIRW